MAQIKDNDKDRLIKAFPASLREDAAYVVNILPPGKTVWSHDGSRLITVQSLISEDAIQVFLDNEMISLPYRIYMNELNVEVLEQLTIHQQIILHCIYTRHFNGHIREASLAKLYGATDGFVIPFIVQLLADQVLEILIALQRHVTGHGANDYAVFTRNNPKYWQQTQDRMVSYWNAYYRPRYPKIGPYPGKQIAHMINLAEMLLK